ncbi:glucose-6-phosphate isomerase [Terricaulis sp.]|uniref:glucose-6-phosphate isomerase n=1 Tax=Terricaulis sp. TaxID=2768686 RepID=UPI003783DA7F
MNATTFAAMKQAWTDVEREAARLAKTSLEDLFTADSARVAALTFSAPHLIADFSKQRIDQAALARLGALAQAADFDGWRAKMFAGEVVNNTENRGARHWQLRGADAPTEVKDVQVKMAAFAKRIRPEVNAIVHLGIGGSDLGPRLIMDALKPLRAPGIDVRFAANVDGADVADAIDGLDPKRTLLIVVSKTFTTQETLANAEFVRAWGPAHLAAATAAPDKAVKWGVPEANVFPFWDWVGGRYSLWSSVSLACVVALKDGSFEALLDGAAEMDAHFRTSPFAQNLPALSAAIQMWNREALEHGSYAVIPYAERLRLLPAYMQQLEMESNGKRVSRDGDPIARSACGVTWGAAGTNAQHSFFQLLHQGVQEIPVEFIVNAGPQEGPQSHRAKVYANALAQARALMVGKSEAAVRAEMIAKGVSESEADRLAPHRTFPGDRASTLMAIDALTPQALGALLAFYEHRTFTQAVLAGINPFDQWGVELGKEMANALLPALEGGQAPADLDASTVAWVKRLG